MMPSGKFRVAISALVSSALLTALTISNASATTQKITVGTQASAPPAVTLVDVVPHGWGLFTSWLPAPGILKTDKYVVKASVITPKATKSCALLTTTVASSSTGTFLPVPKACLAYTYRLYVLSARYDAASKVTIYSKIPQAASQSSDVKALPAAEPGPPRVTSISSQDKGFTIRYTTPLWAEGADLGPTYQLSVWKDSATPKNPKTPRTLVKTLTIPAAHVNVVSAYTFTSSSLVNDTPYTATLVASYRLVATSTYGFATHKQAQVPVTPARYRAPGLVTNLAAVPDMSSPSAPNTGRLLISWVPPQDQGSAPVSSYRVQVCLPTPDPKIPPVCPVDTTTGITSFTSSALPLNDEQGNPIHYTPKITAVNNDTNLNATPGTPSAPAWVSTASLPLVATVVSDKVTLLKMPVRIQSWVISFSPTHGQLLLFGAGSEFNSFKATLDTASPTKPVIIQAPANSATPNPLMPYGMLWKVTSAPTALGPAWSVSGTTASISDMYSSLSEVGSTQFDGSAAAAAATFKPAAAGVVVPQSLVGANASIEATLEKSFPISLTVEFGKPGALKHVSFIVDATISASATLDVSIEPRWGIPPGHANLQASARVGIEVNVGVKFRGGANMKEKIGSVPLGAIPVAGVPFVVSLNIYVVLNLNGELSITAGLGGSVEAGAWWDSDDPATLHKLPPKEEFHTSTAARDWTVTLAFTVESGLSFGLSVTPFDLPDGPEINLEVGLRWKLEGSGSVATGKTVNVGVYLYFRYSADWPIDILFIQADPSFEFGETPIELQVITLVTSAPSSPTGETYPEPAKLTLARSKTNPTQSTLQWLIPGAAADASKSTVTSYTLVAQDVIGNGSGIVIPVGKLGKVKSGASSYYQMSVSTPAVTKQYTLSLSATYTKKGLANSLVFVANSPRATASTGSGYLPKPATTPKYSATRVVLNQVDTPEVAPVFSPNGRYLAFTTSAALDPTDANGKDDVYVLGLGPNPVRVSVDVSGGGSGGGREPAWSPDSEHLAFRSLGNDLGDPSVSTGGAIVSKDVKTGVLQLVSTRANGVVLTPSYRPSWSPDGASVTFESGLQVYAKSLVSGTLTVVSSSAAGTPGDAQSSEAQWSPAGPWVLFSSQARNIIPDHGGSIAQVYRKNTITGDVQLVSKAAGGLGFAGGAGEGRWSPDATSVLLYGAPQSSASLSLYTVNVTTGEARKLIVPPSQPSNATWVPGDNQVVFDTSPAGIDPSSLYQEDPMVGIYNVVSLTPQGAAGDGISLLPGVSSDGNWLAYYTSSSNIGGSYPGGYYDLVVARLVK